MVCTVYPLSTTLEHWLRQVRRLVKSSVFFTFESHVVVDPERGSEGAMTPKLYGCFGRGANI